MKLDDSTIAQIAKVLQIAILTGTDIVDNLRLMRFINEDNSLFMDPEYKEVFEASIQKMLASTEQSTI